MTATDEFLGTWEIDASRNNYEFGNPPQKGTYIIEAQNEGYLITMQWTDIAGKDFEMSYEAIPDGVEYPSDAPNVDKMSMTRVDEKTLDTAAIANDTVIAFGRRVLADDGQSMTITQSGKTPDGVDFANVSVYLRQA